MDSATGWPTKENERTLNYESELRQRWKEQSGLCREWLEQYKSGLFGVCELDFSNAQHQTSFHFGEWYAAIQYVREGWNVLLPKYTHRTRPERRAETQRIIGRDGFDFLICKPELPEKRGSGLVLRKPPKPDLLVYKKPGDFFFAEVKRDRDRLFPAQREFFRMVEQKLDCRVWLVHVREA